MVAKIQRGQALIEFIIFLPFMLMMYMVVVNLGDAIHGSINQQKVTRSYFYYRLQNNSQISKPQRNGSGISNTNWEFFGHTFIGWADYLDGGGTGVPYLSCWRLNLPFAPAAGDSCDDSYDEVTTQFIRVATAYGICGATFYREGGNSYAEQPSTENLAPALLSTACWIK